MVSLDSILENIIAEVIIIFVSFLVSVFIPKLISKVKSEKKFDLLGIAIFLVLISISNLILNLSFWNISELNIFLVLTTGVLGYLTYYIYEKQCPSCKKVIRAKNLVNDKLIKKYTRERTYQPMKHYLYSNGETWKKEHDGKERTRTEHWETRQHFFKCNHCDYEWDSGHFNINTDEKIKPRIIKTEKEDPN